MADKESLQVIRKGVLAWNKYREGDKLPVERLNFSGAGLNGAELNGANLIRANLNGAYLIGANLKEANLKGANLNGADLIGANLYEANLNEASLIGANLNGANLNEASLIRANLTGASLRETNLNGANFDGATLIDANLIYARLDGANLSEAILGDTIFGNIDLTHTNGLDFCLHSRSSILDHGTLARSNRLSIRFLRGCGLPDLLIDYLPSLLNQAIQFYSCFISYSTKDQAFAERLHSDLQNKGVRCWFAPHNIQGGKKIHEQIDEAIRLYDRLLVILSEASMSSEWVKTEYANARQKEIHKGKRVLFPVSLVPFEAVREWRAFDADTGKDSAREIREYFIPDFSNWKDHDDYQKAFERLLKDLRADGQ